MIKRFYFAKTNGETLTRDIRLERDMSQLQYWIDRREAVAVIAEVRAQGFTVSRAVWL